MSASMVSTTARPASREPSPSVEADAAEQEFGVEVLALLVEEGDVLDEGRGNEARDLDAGRGEVNSVVGGVEEFQRAVARLDAVGDGDAARFEQGGQAHGRGPGGIVHGDGKRERRCAGLDAAVDADGGIAGNALGEDQGFEFGVGGDRVDMVVDVVEFRRAAVGDLALRALLRAGRHHERHFVAVDGEGGDGLARAGDDVVEAPARRPGLARVERLVGDDGVDFGDAVGETASARRGQAIALAVRRVDQRGVARRRRGRARAGRLQP